MKNLIKPFMVASLVIVSCFNIQAFAHDITGAALGTALNAVDFYQITCSDDGTGPAARLDLYVRDNTAGTNVLSTQVRKGFVALNITDPKGADGIYSPLASLPGGNGVYDVYVDKKLAGARNYDLAFHCITAGNLHTGTSVVTRQNK